MAVFAAVVKTGNFSRAGKLLGISRPAVSAQIQKLEESLSVRLIQRTTRSVSHPRWCAFTAFSGISIVVVDRY
ncbi:LysR family transcriptional regulator [Enterovibrio sp. Hal110]